MEKRHLSLDLLDEQTNDGIVRFRIGEQTHRGVEFAPENKVAETASVFDFNGVGLGSEDAPDIVPCRALFVKGSNTDNDDKVLTCSREFFNKCEDSVAAYNIKYGGE